MLLAIGCNQPYYKTNTASFAVDSATVYNYIKKGDSLYASKASYLTFYNSMDLYDSAMQIASSTKDTGLLAASILAKGRAFDAMNSNPQKTIDYYTQAAQLYATMPSKQLRYLYIKHLVAHSYDKVKDSVNCIKILNELFTEIKNKPDTVRKKMEFIAEMALISSEVSNYTLADSILQYLTKREWIKNDRESYDYLNHYYLTRARIAVFLNHTANTPYLDTVVMVLQNSTNPSDSLYFSNQLYELYKKANNFNKQNYYLQISNKVNNKFKSPENIREAQDKLAKMELAAVEYERKVERDRCKAILS